MATELAVFGAGCFWGVEEAFRKISGVTNVTTGYAGGKTPNPTYEEVSTGETGHAEVVQVEYDSDSVSYNQLLDAFWEMHRPTEVDRQGPDVGSQYRSIILTNSEKQDEMARTSRDKLEERGVYDKPLATKIRPLEHFYPAEEYHQRYLAKQK